HTRFSRDWSSDVCSSDLQVVLRPVAGLLAEAAGRVLVDVDVVGGEGVDQPAVGVGDVHAVAVGLVQTGRIDAVGDVAQRGGGAGGDAEVGLTRLQRDAEGGGLHVTPGVGSASGRGWGSERG